MINLQLWMTRTTSVYNLAWLSLSWSSRLEAFSSCCYCLLKDHYGHLLQVAINWCICKGTIPIPGVKSVKQAEENLGSLGWRLSSDEIFELESAAKRSPKKMIQNIFQTRWVNYIFLLSWWMYIACCSPENPLLVFGVMALPCDLQVATMLCLACSTKVSELFIPYKLLKL